MQQSHTHFIGPKDCPYRMNGVNLVELRRTDLLKLGRAVKLTDVSGTKNEILGSIIVRLRSMEAPRELSKL